MIKYCFWVFPIILSACMTPLPDMSIERWSDTIIAQERKNYIAPKHVDPSRHQFTFNEAIQRAVAISSELRNSEYALALAELDVEQAKSEIWPRLSIDGFYEIPLDDDSSAENSFDGGIRISYDLTKALFRRDLMTAASVKRQMALTQARFIYSQLYARTLNQVAELNVLKSKIQVLNHTLEALYKEKEAIQSVAGIKGWPTSGNLQLDAEIRNHERLKRVALSRSRYLSQDLKQTLAVESENELMITDIDNVLSALTSRYSVQESFSNQLSQALQQRPDIRLAVLDIMLSVLNLRKAEIERWPRIGMSLGYGDYDLRTSEEDVDAVGTISVSIPVFDFGDIRRKHQAAWINEQRAREEFRSLSRRAGNDLRAAVAEAGIARTDYEDAVQWSEKSLERMRQIESLYKSNRIEHSDRFQAIIAAAGTELDMLEAKLRWYNAAIALAVARADELTIFQDTYRSETTSPAN